MIADIRVPMDRQKIEEFGHKWRITEFALFGSVLGDYVRPGSDVDVPVRVNPQARWGLFDLAQMEIELAAIFDRRVDLVQRDAVERSDNYIRRHEVLSTAELVYAEG